MHVLLLLSRWACLYTHTHIHTHRSPQSALLHAVPIRQRAFAVIGSSMLVAKQDQVPRHSVLIHMHWPAWEQCCGVESTHSRCTQQSKCSASQCYPAPPGCTSTCNKPRATSPGDTQSSLIPTRCKTACRMEHAFRLQHPRALTVHQPPPSIDVTATQLRTASLPAERLHAGCESGQHTATPSSSAETATGLQATAGEIRLAAGKHNAQCPAPVVTSRFHQTTDLSSARCTQLVGLCTHSPDGGGLGLATSGSHRQHTKPMQAKGFAVHTTSRQHMH
jgi:hypothetical protein